MPLQAFPIASADDLASTTEYEGRADYFLFDTKCNSYGGSGKQFDWSVLASYKGNTPFLLSGGTTPTVRMPSYISDIPDSPVST